MTATGTAIAPQSALRRKERSLWLDAVDRFSRNRLSVASSFVILLLVLMAIFADVLAPAGYDHQVYREAWQFPSWTHPMGTDPYGRDLLSRIIYGARISMSVALIVNAAALLIGAPLGALAGWLGGAIDYLLMRVVDVMSAFPTLLFAILMLTMLGSGLINIYIAVAATSWIPIARLVRGQMLSLREQDFVLAARAIGATDWNIVVRHLLPNALTPVIVSLSLGIPAAIMAEAGLSFLGIGVNAPVPSWGKMLNEYLPNIQSHWYLSTFPGLMIALTMYAFTLAGDGLQDALNPTVKK